MAIACPVFSSFSLEKSQGIKRGHFIVLRCACPRDHHRCFHCCFHTPLAHFPTLATTRSRPGIFLSAEAQAGGGVAVFLALECR